MKFLKIFGISIKSGTVTVKYPFEEPLITNEFRGKIEIDPSKCTGCGACTRICPSKALSMVIEGNSVTIRYFIGRCIFCGMCAEICPQNAITITREFELATDEIHDLYNDVEHEAMQCSCGNRFLTKKLVNEVAARVKHNAYELLQLCPECRRRETVKRLTMKLTGIPR
ncbi:MAG TPA: 4Fe-4S dicluster domain-containing protein [Ignisphaera sp.]|nr:4Fe-4S dicluster domain-containing protein [Ignisphaera sp.]